MSESVLPMFSSRSFIVSGLTFFFFFFNILNVREKIPSEKSVYSGNVLA